MRCDANGTAAADRCGPPRHSFNFSVLPIVHPRQQRELLRELRGYERAMPLTRSDRLLPSSGAQ